VNIVCLFLFKDKGFLLKFQNVLFFSFFLFSFPLCCSSSPPSTQASMVRESAFSDLLFVSTS